MRRRVFIGKKEDSDGRFHMQTVANVDDFQVAPWSPGDVEKGDACTQVHIMYTCPMDDILAAYALKRGIPMIAIRIKSREAMDSLIAALIKHRDQVWPDQP